MYVCILMICVVEEKEHVRDQKSSKFEKDLLDSGAIPISKNLLMVRVCVTRFIVIQNLLFDDARGAVLT